jgi:hypothetical protein
MTPRRISAKLFAQPDAAAGVDLRPVIGLFHRCIQEEALEGLLLDVADYAHVPAGPGVILIGHDVDYAIDLTDRRAGLLTTRKRHPNLPLGELLRDTLRRALLAVQRVEADASAGLRFATGEIELRFIDQFAAPNTQEAYESVCKEIEPLAVRLFGASGFELARARADDPREMLTVSLSAAGAAGAAGGVDASALLERLGGA